MNQQLILDEPQLEFRYGQQLDDPRHGLSLFGPYDADSGLGPRGISYGIVGTDHGIGLFKEWVGAMTGAWAQVPNDNYKLWPIYPGFQVSFNTIFGPSPIWTHKLDDKELNELARRHSPYERAYHVAGQYLQGFNESLKLDANIGVMICIVPEEVWINCRSQSRISKGTGEVVSQRNLRMLKDGQTSFIFDGDQTQYGLSLDFRRQLKARAMAYRIPLQIIRESTLRIGDEHKFGRRSLSPMVDRLWNLSSALYYKGGGKPWKITTARNGVCYVGLAFRRSERSRGASSSAVCAAQMFLDDGDGIVFLGDYGPWYSPINKQFQLTGDAAFSLLKGTLDTYMQLHGQPLKEVFVHSRSQISEEEFDGYASAVPDGVDVVGIRVRTERNGPRLYRQGSKWPVIRGTLWRRSDRQAYLYGSGFRPNRGTYDGWETPVPLQIDIQHGQADITRVAEDIFGLTKLNYNACNTGDSEPVTIGYSDAVGEILVSNPEVDSVQHPFKYYM